MTPHGGYGGLRMNVPTLHDVAARAGVHVATASRALNAETRTMVKLDTAARVLAAATELGYQPNPIARGLKTNRSMSVGLVIPDLTNPLFPPIVRGIEDFLMGEGYAPLLVNTDNSDEREALLVTALRRRQVDGMIFATARLEHPAIARLAAEKVPLVLVNRRLDHPELPSVISDDAAGVIFAVEHLIALGHTRIAHLAGPQWTSTGKARLAAFRRVMKSHSLDSGMVARARLWSEGEGARAMGGLMTKHADLTAVVAGNDLLALGCYDYMYQNSIVCPDDLSVVGFNDMQFVDKVRPGLTTVALPQYEIGARAAELLLERIRHPSTPVREVVLPVALVVRGSTAAPAATPRPPGARPVPAARN